MTEPAPLPEDGGACAHLIGLPMPSVALPSTADRLVELDRLPPGRTVLYLYPRTSPPDGAPLPGWDTIPGARGCTPQSCAFRDHHAELSALGAGVYGVSTQPTEYQREMAARLHLPFEVLSDAEGRLTAALRLPWFEVDGMRLLKRATLILRDGAIEHVFYPVVPPERSASDVAHWLRAHPAPT